MPTTPLTHHEILALVEPLARRGRQLDLAASDRAERRLAFQTREVTVAPPLGPVLQETLILEQPASDVYRLTRTLTTQAGLMAELRVEGEALDGLIERLERVPAAGRFLVRQGVILARSDRLVPDAAGPAATDRVVLAGATAELGVLRFAFDTMTGPGWPAEIRLTPAPGQSCTLPEDLLAVLGWSWKALERTPQGWRSSLRVAKREPERTADCERKLTRTFEHLVRTLGQPPGRFHQRLRLARWVFVGRRLAGILVVLGALVCGPAILYFDPPHDSVLRLLAFNTPNLLIIAWFGIRERPSLRPPRRPRPLSADAWAPPPAPPGASGRPAPTGRWQRTGRWLTRIIHP
ncbi:hypothetical protein [uncultured Thiodictyon sp.]|uniref:hypothetical protein n=1 Tax=uncultured Thiodictyon sp. TaxID=1846217 RepID=UPI0025FA3099|nr:hypothetical protein [uncultured Thiodictyon sp.]